MLPSRLLQTIDLASLTGLSLRLSRGELIAEIAQADLEYALLQIAREAAASHGVEIESAQLTFEPDTAASLRFLAAIVARKILFTARLKVTGRLLVDDALRAMLTEVKCSGDGMVGDLAALAVQPELDKYSDRPLPIAWPAGAPVRLEDIRLDPGPPVRVTARVRQIRKRGG